MAHSIEIIKREQLKTTTWSGGTTTELAIYPKDSVYSKRNFMWRLSSAVVQDEKSTFTSLPGVWRHIMIIKGEMFLEHEGQHNVYLKPFEQDSFSGEWTTKSTGKVIDFNLMVASGCKGKLEAIHTKKDDGFHIKGERLNHSSELGNFTEAFYCTKGKVMVNIDEVEEVNLNEGDLLLVNIKRDLKPVNIKINGTEELEASIIRASIIY